jgi:hypothetical protein
MQSIFALPRRALRAVTALAMITVLVGLMSFGASAQADPYPPSTPTHPASTPTDPVTSVTTTHAPSGGAAHGLAYTGFATITAVIIAACLLGGGLLLVTVGRRRGTHHR